MEEDERNGVKAFDTGLLVLNAFIGAEPLLMLKSVAERAGMHPAKVHRYLVSLCRAGFVAQDEVSGHYRLGQAALRLGLAAETAVDVVREAKPVMFGLCQQLTHSVMLGVWVGHGAMVALQELQPGPITITASAGTIMPLLRSSTGQTFAAWMPSAQMQALLKSELNVITAAALRDLPRTMAEANTLLADVKRRGMARVVGQVNAAVSGMSVPVFDRSGRIAAVITALGPTGSIDMHWSGATASALSAAATELMRRIGGIAPDAKA